MKRFPIRLRNFRVLPLAFLLALAPTLRAAEIHELVKQRDLDKLKALLKASPALINQASEAGDTPLFIAAFRGDRVLVDLLLGNKANPNVPPNQRGETPLSVAVEQGYKGVAAALRKAGAVDNDLSHGAAIRYAATHAQREELAKLLQANPKLVDARDGMGNTALYLAAYTSSKLMVDQLLGAQADPNAENRGGGTPYSIARERDDAATIEMLRKAGGRENRVTAGLEIRQAARQGDVEKLRTLLAARPELRLVKDDLDRTPLHEAAAFGSASVVEYLLQMKAEVDARDYARATPLISASAAGQAGVVEMLLAAKADPNARTRQDTTALLSAAARGHAAVIEKLLNHGAEIQQADNLGYTVLHWAAANNHAHLVALLIARKASLAAVDRLGNTPLHLACSRGRKDIAAAFLNAGAALNARNRDGTTPLGYALKSQQGEIVELLRAKGGKE